MISNWANFYLQANFLILVGYGLLTLITIPQMQLRGPLLRPSTLLRIAYGVAISFILFPKVISFFPKKHSLFPEIMTRTETIFSQFSIPPRQLTSLASPFSGLSENTIAHHNPTGLLATICLILCGIGVAISGFKFMNNLKSIHHVIYSSFKLKKVGNIVLLASSRIHVPFSFYLPMHAYVVVPEDLIDQPTPLRLAISHELQHHKQGDTQWGYYLQFLKAFFFFNPAIHLFERKVSEIQEFACDEALVRTKSISPHAYGSCLLQVAKNSLKHDSLLAGTTSMGASTSGIILKRRISMIFEYRQNRKNRYAIYWPGTLIFAIMATTAWASQQLILEKPITLLQAQKMALQIQQGKNHLPITVNDAVVEQLNRYLNTAESREKVRASLKRMKTYEDLILKEAEVYGLPPELIAVAFAESGFENTKGSIGAGIWMFIPETAKRYHLKVDSKIDERLNTTLETRAAMELLKDDYLLFDDWGLALLAYNAGEKKVQEGIHQTGSHDAWKLAQRGYHGDKDYLAVVMAAALIIHNPKIAE
jgi:beta-lactamase regulating signal transducer with metallopeptidase domain